MRRLVALSGWILCGLLVALSGWRCGSSPSATADEETMVAWTVERPSHGEILRVEDIEPADLGDCREARYRVTLSH